MSQIQIFLKNPYQDVEQAKDATFSTNLSFRPTVEEMNRVTSLPGGISEGSAPAEDEVEPMFGTHIREAAGTIRKLFGTR